MNVHHPSFFLTDEVADTLRTYASEAENLKKLHPKQMEIIYQHKWFKMFVPLAEGGLELSLPQVLQTEEALSWADGSTAWVVTLCSGAGWFVGFTDNSIEHELFADDKMCFAGSGAATGDAEITDGGYVINGRWKYASGAEHATVFTANCYIRKNGELLQTEDGKPAVASFMLKRNEVTLRHTWHTMGMQATGSHSFEVKEVQVPAHRCFYIDAKQAVLPHLIYQYPFLQLAETTLAVNMSGMAMRFIELCEMLWHEKGGEKSTSILNAITLATQTKNRLNQSRQLFYEAVNTSWNELLSHKQISALALDHVSEASHNMVKVARQSINDLYPLCGLRAADTATEINRVWRNMHTAGQHALFHR